MIDASVDFRRDEELDLVYMGENAFRFAIATTAFGGPFRSLDAPGGDEPFRWKKCREVNMRSKLKKMN